MCVWHLLLNKLLLYESPLIENGHLRNIFHADYYFFRGVVKYGTKIYQSLLEANVWETDLSDKFDEFAVRVLRVYDLYLAKLLPRHTVDFLARVKISSYSCRFPR